MLAYSSPGIFAVRRVLHRITVLRHPPYALTYFHLFLLRSLSRSLRLHSIITKKDLKQFMVENDGFEPTTSAVQKRRSPN